ncbi:dynein light chain Tctex-type protein 2B-like isoform X2 [Littorina saxatilis]|uniref:Uncharacterized protein n=1 Tax=Littorina saxatilis TaxID=31220 RepID=A0AAN9BM35_9CAEN
MADLLRPSQVGVAGRRRTIIRLTPGAHGRLKNLSNGTAKEGSDAPDSSRPMHFKQENSYRMTPQDSEKFQPGKVKKAMFDVLEERLQGVTYDSRTCQDLAKELAAEIQKRVKEFRWHRYRVVCQVTLGQQTQQGLQVASRCVWDHMLDNQASITYDNKSVFAVAQCYGVYFE